MRKFPFVLLAAALTTLTLSACELDPEGDADATDTPDNTDVADDNDVEPDTTPLPDPYRYVRINDLSPQANTIDGGADIDAVILDKADGTQHFASTVEGFEHGGGLGDDLDPQEALDAPDAFTDWESADPVCSLDAGFVSLGGSGGFLIVGMPADIETGDTLSVLEIGGCTGNDGGEGIPEEVEVEISVAKEVDSAWVTLGSLEGPVVTFTVPEL